MEPGVSQSDRYFGIGYLITLTALPVIYVLYKLVRDRNDFVVVSADVVEYKDNADQGTIPIANIVKVETLSNDLTLTLADGT